MIVSDHKLYYKDHQTLVETVGVSDGSRAMEWRRSLNDFKLEATQFSVLTDTWVGKIESADEIRRRISGSKDVVPVISGFSKTKISIHTEIIADGLGDKLYRTRKLDGSDGMFSVSRGDFATKIILSISEDNPAKSEEGVFMPGSYFGWAGFWGDDNSLNVKLTANKDAILELVDVIESGRLDRVVFNIAISSFSYEVDDALSDWTHSRDILVHGISTPATLESFGIRRISSGVPVGELGESPPSTTPNYVEKTIVKTEAGNIFDGKSIQVDSKYLKSIALSLWALVVVLLFILAK